MAGGVQRPGTSPKNEPVQADAAEDAETRATRRELKQSSISDQLSDEGEGITTEMDRPDTPTLSISDAQSHALSEQVFSPQKKRAHDQLEGNQGSDENDITNLTSSELLKNRTIRHEPEKKRYREKESSDVAHESPLPQFKGKIKKQDQQEVTADAAKISRDTSSITLAGSAFGKLASKSSGFASLGSSPAKELSSAKPEPSSLVSTTSSMASQPRFTIADNAHPAATPTLSFSSSSGASPFAGLSSKANGSGALGFGPLSNALSGFKPSGSCIASGTKSSQIDKTVRPFGAPDSDASEDEEDYEHDRDSEWQLNDKLRRVSPDKDIEDKKRPKLHKIQVDDGEAGEVTVVSVRAKMFSLDKQTGWKERGAGMLKINVPDTCVEFNDSGTVIPGSFDVSDLEAGEKPADDKSVSPKVARLILRQDQTHRVILNTAILPAMEFQEKASLKSVGILFTAFEGDDAKPVSITIRMSAANSKLFLNEINAIQRELRGN